MSKASVHSVGPDRAKSSLPAIDMCSIVAISGCVYAAILAPLWFYEPDLKVGALVESRPENRFFWPIIAAIAVALAVRYLSRLRNLTWPPHIICLFAYLALAGASVSWAVKPDVSFTRFVLQVTIVTSIVLPAMLAARTTDMMPPLFLCFAVATMLNVFFVFNKPVSIINNENWGYTGYFNDKNSLGQFAAIAFLLALHEVLHSGLRRASGIITIIITIWLLLVSQSKTSLALALCVPAVAGLALAAGKMLRVSVATILLSIAVCYDIVSRITGFSMNRISYMIYGNPNFSGRTIIWDLVQSEIARRPLFGWGYQSYWQVGPDGPSITDIGGWVGALPHAHNGYFDVMLETGRVGFVLFVIFIITTLYAIGRVADRDRARAWLLLSLALFVIFDNFLETVWMRGFHVLWLVFVVVAAEAARYSQYLPKRPAGRARIQKPTGSRLSRSARGALAPTGPS
jgi:exopolysaccharide production protein ExoQ